ncbi:MAG: methionyl-tRNA formyltransferase [Fretibacterium sp.]|nr:methionyl-tRNA formyltransferase [Fretibacterium sp.]
MRIWFFGSGGFAARCLAFMAPELHFERVVTGFPTRSGRGLKERPLPVEEIALSLGLPLERTGPLSENEPLLRALSDPPDVIFVVDFAQKIREPFLSAPQNGCLNIHPSLLPKWRGAAPVARSLMNGDSETGVTIFRLVEQMDAGPILLRKSLPLSLENTSGEVMELLSEYGAQIAVYGVKSILEGTIKGTNPFQEQDHASATYAPKIEKSEAEVSWNRPALEVHNLIRALSLSPGAFVPWRGRRLKLWKAHPVSDGSALQTPGQVIGFEERFPVVACTEGALRLEVVQQEGKRALSGAEWARGIRLKEGDAL